LLAFDVGVAAHESFEELVRTTFIDQLIAAAGLSVDW
jgi:hypothetical protein